MIKATTQTPTGPLLILGLTGENITRLAAGEPILTTAAELAILTAGAINTPICIAYGRDTDTLRNELNTHFKALHEHNETNPNQHKTP